MVLNWLAIIRFSKATFLFYFANLQLLILNQLNQLILGVFIKKHPYSQIVLTQFKKIKQILLKIGGRGIIYKGIKPEFEDYNFPEKTSLVDAESPFT